MAIFTRTRTTVPPAQPPKALVVAYSNPSASVSVSKGESAWELLITTQTGVQGRFTFGDKRAAVGAAGWLAYQNLDGIGSKVGPGLDWVSFVDAISDARERPVSVELADALPELSPAVIEHVLEVHYAQVLSSKEGRKMWAKLLRDVATVERAQQIRKDAR